MSKSNLADHFSVLKNDNQIFLNYLKAKFPLFHNSNIFSRDFQYGLKGFLEKKNIYIRENDLIQLADDLSKYFEAQGIFVKTSSNGWKLNYPEFLTQKPGDPFSF